MKMKTNETELRIKNEELARLVAKARSGDQTAFTELYDRTGSDLFRCIRAMTRDEELTWDIQQDSYLRAFKNLDQLESGEAFFPWLRRIAVNVTADRMKQRLPLTFTELSGDEDGGMPELPDPKETNQPELSLDRKETARLVKEILSQLPEAQQMIVGMRYYDELSVKEIAELLKLSDGTVKAQLFHGRKKVEAAVRALEKQGIKLYGLSPIAFLTALLRRMEPAEDAAGTKAAASAAAPVVLQAAKPFFSTTLGKLVLGVIAAGVVAGGVAAYRWAKENVFGKTDPVLMVDTSEDLKNDPTAPTLPVVIETTGEVELDTTEPDVTEPAVTESAEPVRAANQCGEHLTWSFFPDYSGLLRIQGNGDMYDFVNAEDIPWYSIRNEIQQVKLPDNLTSIGDYAFAGCENLNSCYLYSTAVTRIGSSAFEGCTSLSLWLPETLTDIGDRAFAGTLLTSLDFPEDLCEVNSTAFQGCDKLSLVYCPEEVTALNLDAFAECAGLREIWVLNAEAAIRGSLADGAQVTVCGLPGSTAEQYAAENGLDFDPMEDSRDELLELVKRTADYEFDYDGETCYYSFSLHYNGVMPVGDRYVSQIIRSDPLTVTEEEIQQARETGSIVLLGEKFEYTESEGQVRERFGEDIYEPEDLPVVGYILGKNDSYCYFVCRQDGSYCFYRLWGDSYGSYEPYLCTHQPIGWLWMDADDPVFVCGALGGTMANFHYNSYPGAGVSYSAQLAVIGTDLMLHWASAGKP